MQKLILQYQVSDDCTFSVTETVPFYGESVEAALFDLEILWEKPRKDSMGFAKPFNFAGVEFYKSDFTCDGEFHPPRIMTVEDWFSNASLQ